MKHAKLVLRILLGLVYFAGSLTYFLSPPPPPMPGVAGAFAAAMMATGYFFPFLKITELIGGFLLLSGFFVPLALIILAPITLHIVLFHAFLMPEGMYIQVAMLIVHLTLGYMYRASYREVLKAKA